MFNFDFMLSAIANTTNMTREVQQGVLIALMVIMSILAIAMIVVVLMQQGTADNVQAITGSSTDSYYGKNKARSKEGLLKKITLIIFCLIMVISIIFFIISLVDVGQGVEL